MTTVEVGIFRLDDPPAGQEQSIRDTVAAINFPWKRLAEILSEPVRVVWTDMGQVGTGQMIGTREMRLSTRYSGWQDRVPFVFAHECGHLVDNALLRDTQRTELLELMHASPETHRYNGQQMNGEEHPWSHNQPHGPGWRGAPGDTYLFEPDESFADLFVATFAPTLIDSRRVRFVHWTTDVDAVRSIVLRPPANKPHDDRPEPQRTPWWRRGGGTPMPDDITIVTREEWGAAPPDHDFHAITVPTAELWFHHFGSEHHGAEGMREIQRFHQEDRGWNDFAYSYAIDDDGTIFEGRGAKVAAGATKYHNAHSHAIVAMGNLHARKPTKAQVRSAAKLLAHGYLQGWWPKEFTGGHREAKGHGNDPDASTACPGDHGMAALPDINALAHQYLTQKEEIMDRLLQLVIGLHEVYFGLVVNSPQWNEKAKKYRASVNWHYAELLNGTPENVVRQRFADTAGV